MDHLPINHQLRGFWRVLAFLTGAYVLVFGIVGLIQAGKAGVDTFAQTGLPTVLLLKANPGFALMSIITGALVVLAVIIGRNVDRWINLIAGSIFILAGTGMLLVIRTDLNYLGFTMATCIASSIIGCLLLTAGLYGRIGSRESEHAEEARRHRTVGSNQGVVGDA